MGNYETKVWYKEIVKAEEESKMSEDKSFKEFVDSWKCIGYEVHVSEGFLEDLERLEKGWEPDKWDILSAPLFLLADILCKLLDRFPQNRPIRRLWSEMANLAITVNRPLAKRLDKREEPHKTYRIA